MNKFFLLNWKNHSYECSFTLCSTIVIGVPLHLIKCLALFSMEFLELSDKRTSHIIEVVLLVLRFHDVLPKWALQHSVVLCLNIF